VLIDRLAHAHHGASVKAQLVQIQAVNRSKLRVCLWLRQPLEALDGPRRQRRSVSN
jgi:hypothetical protein